MSICDLFKDLRAYANKVISVTGQLYLGSEIFALAGQCDGKFVTKFAPTPPAIRGARDLTQEYVWPTALYLADSSEVGTGDKPVAFVTDRKARDQVLGRIKSERSRLADREVRVLVTGVGQLRLKDQYYVGKAADGTLIGGGYGHLGIYPGELVIKTMRDPVIETK